MQDKSQELGIGKVLLGAAFAALIAGISFGLGWYAKELSVIKQKQSKFQDVIEDVQNNTRQMMDKVAAIEKNQIKLHGMIMQKQSKFQDVIEDVQNNTRQMMDKVAAIEKNQIKLHGMIIEMQTSTRKMAGKIAAIMEKVTERMSSRSLLEVISVEPPSPAVLNPGEKLHVKFRYRLGSCEAVQIWARPYTNGRKTRGYRAHGSSVYKKAVRESGVAEGSFFFDEPAVIDEVRINMQDVASRKDVHTTSYKIDARWIGPDISKKEQANRKKQACQQGVCVKVETGRISIDVNNPDGEAGWKDEYVIRLKSTGDIRKYFGVNWYRPHKVARIFTEKPDFINALPKFRYEMQRYLILRLGDAENNHIAAAMDFRKPDRKHFPFDLYLDRDRDGDLAEDFITDSERIKGISTPYKDGTTESYALHLYAYSNEPIAVAYQSHAGRYGILEADRKRIQILVIDNSGNGIFNDADDVILLDWDLDGKIDGSHQADDDRPLYSPLELPGGRYRVAEFDTPGRRMALRRQTAK